MRTRATPLVLGVAVRKDNSAHLLLTLITRLFVHQEKCPAALQLAKSLLSSRRRLCSASLDGGPASSFQSPRSTHGFNSAANSPRRTVVQYFSGSSTDIA